MNGNRSTAVMQRREATSDDRHGPRGFVTSLDYFPTPPWATRAACEFLEVELGEVLAMQTCWEPACGEGFMTRPLRERFAHVVASDVQRYDDGHQIYDFTLPGEPLCRPEWIFTNPPFKLAADFVRLAIERASRGVVMFVRGAFTEGDERYRQMFAPRGRPRLRGHLLRARRSPARPPDPRPCARSLQPRRRREAPQRVERHQLRDRGLAPRPARHPPPLDPQVPPPPRARRRLSRLRRPMGQDRAGAWKAAVTERPTLRVIEGGRDALAPPSPEAIEEVRRLARLQLSSMMGAPLESHFRREKAE